jgi:hypothetical protein
MTVLALDPMDVVRASRIGESSVHLFDVEAAVGHLGMTRSAGCPRILIVAAVAGEATDALVNAQRSAVVSRTNLRSPVMQCSRRAGLRLSRCVTLIAKSLTLVRTDLYGLGSIE